MNAVVLLCNTKPSLALGQSGTTFEFRFFIVSTAITTMAETTITQDFTYAKGTINATVSLRKGGVSINLDMSPPCYQAQHLHRAIIAATLGEHWGHYTDINGLGKQNCMIFFKILLYRGYIAVACDLADNVPMSQEMQTELAEWCSQFDHIDPRFKQVRTHEIHNCDSETKVCFIVTLRKYAGVQSEKIEVTCAFGRSLTADEIIEVAAKCEKIKRHTIDASCVISASIAAFMDRVDLLKLHNDAAMTMTTLNAATAGGSKESEKYARMHAYKTVLPMRSN
jgi:hypothetical protein